MPPDRLRRQELHGCRRVGLGQGGKASRMEEPFVRTDWELIRAMMRSAIDACERLEALGVGENDRDAWVEIAGRQISVFEILTSAWTYPETLRYQIVRDRHEKGADLPYVPETARVLVNMAQACAELIGARDAAPAGADCRRMMRWYDEHALSGIERAIKARRGDDRAAASSTE